MRHASRGEVPLKLERNAVCARASPLLLGLNSFVSSFMKPEYFAATHMSNVVAMANIVVASIATP